MDVSKSSMQELGASPSLVKRISEADIDKDGTLNIHEIFQLVRSEQRAQADRKLFRNFLIALIVANLILVAVVVGSVFAIVKLTNELDDDGGVLVSTNTGDVIGTGVATDLVDLSRMFNDSSLAEQLNQIIVMDGENFAVHRVGSIRAFPEKEAVVIVSQDGSLIQVDKFGSWYLDDTIGKQLESNASSPMGDAGRRLQSTTCESIVQDSSCTPMGAMSFGTRSISRPSSCVSAIPLCVKCEMRDCRGFDLRQKGLDAWAEDASYRQCVEENCNKFLGCGYTLQDPPLLPVLASWNHPPNCVG